ncbi:MAG: hypothetical protein FJ104_17150, partial [Deltaproteobacteria bacterium]|nr:hypothetical protein [Deltaproteobacteria bacterium]
ARPLPPPLRGTDLSATDSAGQEPSQITPVLPNLPLCEEKILLVEAWTAAGALR